MGICKTDITWSVIFDVISPSDTQLARQHF